jgi:hypothetical protein
MVSSFVAQTLRGLGMNHGPSDADTISFAYGYVLFCKWAATPLRLEALTGAANGLQAVSERTER